VSHSIRRVDWYFDFISPYAYLQSTRLHRLPSDVVVDFRPVLFAGLLNHWGTVGPAEVGPKRRFVYRQVLWYARRHGIEFRMPPAHPFNTLPLLRLVIAVDCDPRVIDAIFRFIWAEGRNPQEPSELRSLAARLDMDDIHALTAGDLLKSALRDATARAAAIGVFGVPTAVVDDQIFWGNDSTQMLTDYLDRPDVFDNTEMRALDELPQAALRKGARQRGSGGTGSGGHQV
jgi:2-hydroxychromene-2-carboxylate isomerase